MAQAERLINHYQHIADMQLGLEGKTLNHSFFSQSTDSAKLAQEIVFEFHREQEYALAVVSLIVRVKSYSD